MGSHIKNYKDLQAEEERLVELLKMQKLRLQADISELKDEVKPVIDVFSIAGKLSTRNNSNILVNTAMDLVIAKIFSKSNLLVWLVFPTLLSNLSSHYVPKLVPLAKNLMKKKNRKKEIQGSDGQAYQHFIPKVTQKNGQPREEEVLV